MENIERYKEKIKKAKEIIESLNLEEPFKSNAFNTLLRSLLEKGEPAKEVILAPEKEKEKTRAGTYLDPSQIPYFKGFNKMAWKEKLLSILKWAKDNYPNKGLVTAEFVRIFDERFGMPYIDSGKINKEITRRLLGSPFITRKKIDQKNFRWFITPQGEENINKILKEKSQNHSPI